MNEFDYLAKVKEKMDSENFIEAKSLCDKALKINSELPDAYNLRGNANYELGYYDEAVSDFTTALEKDPNNSEHYYHRSWAYKRMDKTEDAIVDITKALDIEPKNSLYYYSRAKFKFEIDRYKEAADDYTKGIDIKPTENKYIGRGLCYMRMDMLSEAVIDYSSAIEIEPVSFDAYYHRGMTKMMLEQYEDAIKDFEMTVEIFPDTPYPYIQIGNAKIALGHKDAMQYFNKAVEIFPCADAYLERVNARGKILFRENALKNLSQNKSIEDTTFDMKLFNKKQVKDDIKDLNKALKDEPDNIEILEHRMDRYFYLDQFNKAITDADSLIELVPSNPNYYFARIASKQAVGRYQDSINDCNRLMELLGSIDYDALFLKINAEYRLKQYNNVIEDTNILLCIDESCGGYYYRALAYYKLQNYIKAYSDMKKALIIKPDAFKIYDDKIPKLLEFVLKLSKRIIIPQKNIYKNEQPIGLAGIK